METIAWLSYYFNLILAYGGYYLLYIHEIYVDFPLEVRIAATGTTLIFTLIIILLLGLWRKNRIRSKSERIFKKLDKRFGKAIEYMLSEECKPNLTIHDIVELLGVDEEIKKKKNVLHGKTEKLEFCRVIYKKRISDKSVSGRRANLHQLINLFSLRELLETEASLASGRRKRDALVMLRTFKLYISPWVINKLLASRNKYVQRLAMYTSIMSSSDSDMDYFETSFFDENCCIHDEIELGYVLQRRRHSGMKLPNLANWAYHQKNPNTQCIFVRLMRRFDQKEYCSQLEPLFKESKHKKLIEEISRTWGYLHYVESEKLLVDSLLMQPDDTKVAIMHAITRMATGQSLKVLVDEFNSSTNPHVRFEALRCLYNYGTEGKIRFCELEDDVSTQDRKFFSFFHNPITLGKIRLDKEQAYHPSVETVYNFDI